MGDEAELDSNEPGLGNMSFRHVFLNNSRPRNNSNNNEEFPLNAGERGASPSSLPASPMLPIKERVYTAEEEAVIDKFLNFIQITNVNEKPKLTKVEKEILRGMYWSRGFIDKIKLRLQRMRIGKENANLAKNYDNILKKSRARSRRRKQRKTRKL